MGSDNQPTTAVVEFQIRTETTSLDQWLDEWQKRAEDAYEHEPETTAYEVAVNVEDESRVLVFERYQRGLSSLKKHLARPAHKVLEENMLAHRMTKRRVLFNQGVDVPDYGWWARNESPLKGRGAGYPLTLLCSRYSQSTQRDKFFDLTADHARYCLEAEPDTLVYSGTVAAEDGKPGSPLVKGDLMFMMVCTDAAAAEKHAMDPNHLALGEKFAAEGGEVPEAVLLRYRTSGRGFLWR